MQESLDSTFATRHFQLLALTDKFYDCEDDTIVYSLSRVGSTINLLFKSVYEPGFCFTNGQSTSQGRAMVGIDFGPLSNGVYPFNITYDSSTTIWSLYVDSEVSFVSFKNSAGTADTFDRIIRVPVNTLSVTIGTKVPDKYYLIDNFLDSLQVYGAQPLPLVKGNNYAYDFYINDSSFLATKYTYYKEVVYRYYGDFSIVKNLAAHLEIISDSALNFTLASDKGSVYETDYYPH